MEIKGNNLLVETEGYQESSVFKTTNEYAKRPNQGVIVAIGDKVNDPSYIAGVSIIYAPHSAVEISDSSRVIVAVEGVLVVL